MNWVAHIFLSEYDIDFQLGNYLADPLKLKVWENANNNLKKGMNTHLKIDLYTDSHEIVLNSKNKLREKGLLKSIVIDMTYDYLLTKNWNKFCNINFEEFTNTFYENAKKRVDSFPEKAQSPINRLIENKILNNYKTLDELRIGFNKFDKRLSKKLLSRDTTSSYFKNVCHNIDYLESDFLDFFPQLCNHIKPIIEEKNISHWKI